MDSMTATWTPSSLQLRLVLNGKNCRKSPAILSRTRLKKRGHQVRLQCVTDYGVRNGNGSGKGMQRRRNGGSWIGLDSKGDTFAGWSDSDNGEQSIESQRKKWFEGVVGAGVAGAILVAGLTFAALSLSKRSISKPKQQMDSLTTQQEASLTSDNENDKVEEKANTGDNVEPLDHNQESEKAIDNDLSLSPESNEGESESQLGNCNEASSVDDIKNVSVSNDAIDNTSIQEDLQNEPGLVEKSAAPYTDQSSQKLPESVAGGSFVASSFKDSDGSPSASSPEPSSDGEETSVNVEPTNLSNPTHINFNNQEVLPGSDGKEDSQDSSDSSYLISPAPSEPNTVGVSVGSRVDIIMEPQLIPNLDLEIITSPSSSLSKTAEVSAERNCASLEMNNSSDSGSSGTSTTESAYSLGNQQETNSYNEMNKGRSFFESPISERFAGIPAPSGVSASLQMLPGKVLVAAVVDQVQGQALAALQVLKVIETEVQPSDLCTRREYARWLVSASSILSRNTVSKVYPAMFIENVTELAFDDITPEDPDFSSIQGLAEAGLISSKLSSRDLLPASAEDRGPFCFSPESPLSRQDLVSWKMALEKRQLPEVDRKSLYQLSGFIDIDKINPDAWPALFADLSAGEQGIVALAFGCTRLFQPDKPVTKAQAAVALATGEASDIVSEELARIEAESMAENAVSVHNALVAQVEKDLNASFEKELLMEREKIDAVEKMAEEATQELERLRGERERDNIALMKERAAIESEMEVLSRLRREVEEHLESLMSNKVEISYEKERINKLRKEVENENQEVARLQYELEVERKALSMARAWAEDEAKRAREQAKALEEARDRWEKHGIKVVVDDDLREESSAGVTWLNAGKQFSVEGTVSRAETLVSKLKAMANGVTGKSREIIDNIVQKILLLVSVLKDWASSANKRAEGLKDTMIIKASSSVQELQQSTADFSLSFREGAKRVVGDCREGVEKLSQKFKT